MRPDELIAAWKAWDKAPGNEAAAKVLSEACVAYAGARSNELRVHVAALRRQGRSIAAAIYSWDTRGPA